MKHGGELQTTVAFGSSSTGAAVDRAPPSVWLTSAPPFPWYSPPPRSDLRGSATLLRAIRPPDHGASAGSLADA
jgi:hypothetical protein